MSFTENVSQSTSSIHARTLQRGHLIKRNLKNLIFKWYGIAAIGVTVLFMTLLLITLIYHGWSAFVRTEIVIPMNASLKFSEQKKQTPEDILMRGMLHHLKAKELFHDIHVLDIFSHEAVWDIRELMGRRKTPLPPQLSVQTASWVDQWHKAYVWHPSRLSSLSFDPRLEIYLKELHQKGVLVFSFNKSFFKYGDSQEPEIAGIFGSLIGSLYTLGITILCAFPFGAATAIYLEEFAPKNRLFDFLEININNLAAVPTILFGLLGLFIFLGIFGLPRCSSLVGGLTLALVILPTIIISSRAALKSVPQSIRQAAQGLGASSLQVVFHQVIPLAAPGMLTGALLGLLRAAGETAPLFMLGMIAFIADPPSTIFDPATVLPVQIFSWAKNPSRIFSENASAAILVLLAFLFIINGIMFFIRGRFERKWT